MNKAKKLTLVLIFAFGLVFGISLTMINRTFYSANLLFADNASGKAGAEIKTEDDDYYRYYQMLNDTFNILKKEFYDKDETTAKKMLYGAIKGMMESTGDPYTMFMEPQTSKEFSIDMSGSFGGLGIHIGERDGWLTVIAPIEDTPAWRAGLKPDDKIIEIGTNSTKGVSVNEAVDRLRGKPGSQVTITIARSGISEPFKVTLTREEIKIKNVKSEVITNNGLKTGYVRIIEFSMTTADEFRKNLKQVLDQKPNNLIVDLRNNPGGLLNVVANCVNYFYDHGLIVYTRGRMPENNSDFTASRDLAFVPKDLPMVVMVNGGSASASEIFAGAMQDTHRAVLVGTKSFGKGSVQKTYTFPDDGSLIKYTVAKYFTPSGRCIDKLGLQPDVDEKMWYENIPDAEKDALVKLQYTNLVKQFLDTHTAYGDSDLDVFGKSLSNQGFVMSQKSLKWLIKMKLRETQMPEVYDLDDDNQLCKALDVLGNWTNYRKDFKVYEEAK